MTDSLKKNLVAAIQGLMFGLGFSIAAWVLYFALQSVMQKQFQHLGAANTAISVSAAEHRFVFRDVEEVKRNGRSYFIGSVKNNGSSSVRGASIEINLFAKGKFVDQYSSYIGADIKPGEERYFKISCGCKDEPLAQYDDYKIDVVGGY